MTNKLLHELSQNQKERLNFIDFRLFFLGTINRIHICERFKIAPAAATRDFASYLQLAPKNLHLDGTTKHYMPTDHFKPLFNHYSEFVLSILSKGYADGNFKADLPLFPCEVPMNINRPDVNILAILSRAINLKQALNIEYHSNSSGITCKEIIPFALVNSGLRWHVRAFDRLHNDFRDFVLTRVSQANVSTYIAKAHERADADSQWTRIIELELVPHPQCKDKTVVEKDFSMTNGVLKLQVRAAIAGYMLRRWNVDCSPDHTLLGKEYVLYLNNPLTLYGVTSAAIAPGFIAFSER